MLNSKGVVDCPVCKGVAGVEICTNADQTGEPERAAYAADWFDCDFCDATGKVSTGTIAHISRSRLSKWDARFVALAEHIARWSKGPRTRVGAVVVRPDKSIASVGFNGAPRGFDDEAFLAMPRSEQHKIVLHAEANAVDQTCFAENLHGCTIYVTHMPCTDCADKIIEAGIKRVVAYCGHLSPDWLESAEEAQEKFANAGISCLFATSE